MLVGAAARCNALGGAGFHRMTAKPDDVELQKAELELRREELTFQKTKLSIEFARFGFAGTLTAAIVGMVLIFGLAVLSGVTTFKIDTWAIVVMALVILVGSVAFGYLSLWELPKIVMRIENQQMRAEIGSQKPARE